MDQVLREEQAKLNEVESIIDSAAEASRVKGNALAKDIADFYPIDYEDVGRKKELIDQRKKAAADEAYYLEFKPSPYFGRLDLDREIGDNYELNTYYIGKKGLTIGSDVIIVDWRTPVGECYYAQNQTSFDVKGIVYSLALRRALNIQNAKLINYRTEFDGNTISLEGEVIDPFLITVLQDKRRQNRLTDIIRSIQANQNNIIRQPLGESFIVQGCAGSGKTMILLHRLSYLKFNNRRMPLAGVKIITPNPDFNAHINELSTELDIDTIQKFTVEEYYVDLINRFSRNPNISSVVSSESMLKPDLLGEIYSDSFISQLREQYHLYWTVVLDAVDETRLKASFKLHKIDYPVTDTHNAQVATSLETGVVRIIREFKESVEKYHEAQRRKGALEEEYKKTDELCKQVADEASAIRTKMIETAHAEMAVVIDRIAQISNYTQPSRVRLQELMELDGGASDETRRAERELALIRRNYDTYSDFDSFSDTKDAVSSSIAMACNDLIKRIRDLEYQIQHTPGYSFVKRNSLRRQLQETKSAFTTAARTHVDSLITEKEAAQSAINNAAQAHREEMSELSNVVETADREIKQLQRKQSALDECINELTSSSGINQSLILSVGAQNELVNYLVDYEKIATNLAKQSKNLAEIRKRITMLDEQNKPPFDEDIDYLEVCETEIAKLKANEIYRQVMRKALLKAYSDHGEEYTRTNYRHKLFLMLLFCFWYYKRPINMDTYLNIDEAQDISIAEYTLLRKILGDDCVFNLYGDINQSLFPEKSIMGWEELQGIISKKVFVLNEDYRNTLQITEYCNREFFAEIYPIGIKGEPVSELDLEQGIQWLVELKKTNPDYRVTIITHGDGASIRENLSLLLKGKDVSWYAVDDKKISILTVENAKGLEFEAVIVLCDGMEINEQYIAFTRALDHLCVVKDHVSSNLADMIPREAE